jgi:TusA-related sulfurtransferase
MLPAEQLDVRGLGCGSVLVRLAQVLRDITRPTTILLWTDDGGADEELPSWCRMTKQEFGGKLDTIDGAPRYAIHLTPKPTPANAPLQTAPPYIPA